MAGRRIQLQCYGRQEELNAAAGDIYPGMLIKQNSSGLAIPHGTAGGFAARLFAIEDALQGNTVDTVYASGAPVSCVYAEPGAKINARIAAGAAAIVKGDLLISDGAGNLKKTTGSPTQAIAEAREAVDNSGGGSAVFCECVVI